MHTSCNPVGQYTTASEAMYAEIEGDGSASSRKKSMPNKVSSLTSAIRKNIQCIECGFSCTSYAQLKVHNRIHTGDKPYSCPDCSYASTRNANLQRHITSMHAGRYLTPAIGKRGRPPNSVNPSKTSDVLQIHTSLQTLTSPSTANSNTTEFLDTVTHREAVKSPLSEIRARELMLAENAVHHGTGLPLDITPRLVDTGIRPRLIHPASQVLALPTHIPLIRGSEDMIGVDPSLEQPSVSGYVSNVEDPIVTEDDSVDAQIDLSKPMEGNEEIDTPDVEHQTQLADKPVETYKETVIVQSKKVSSDNHAPVIIAPSRSQDMIAVEPSLTSGVDPSLTPVKHKENDRFECILNDELAADHVRHQISQDISQEVNHSLSPEAATATQVSPVVPVYQEMPTATTSGVELTTAKFHQKDPLVLEVENASIGLYLHLDLSKYLCKTAQRWLSQHTKKCSDVCEANFPVNTSSPPDQAPLMEEETSEMKETDDEPIATKPLMIPISNKVPTISKAPPVLSAPPVIPAPVPAPTQIQAFPTAILAAPPAQPVSGVIEDQATKHIRFPDLNEIHVPQESNMSVDQGLPHTQPVLNPTPKQTINLARRVDRRKGLPKPNRASDSGSLSEHNSLLFQRWPGIKQYMQVRSLGGNQKEFSCYKCGKQFSHLHQLKVHVKNHIKRYHCQQCHYSTHRMANLRRHQLTHRQVDDLTCHVCGGVMANKRAFTMHVLFAHKKQKRKSKDFDMWRKQLSATMAESSGQQEGDAVMDTSLQETSTRQMVTENSIGMAVDNLVRSDETNMGAINNVVEAADESTYHEEQANQNDADRQSVGSTNNETSQDPDRTEPTAHSNEWDNVAIKEELDEQPVEGAGNHGNVDLRENGETSEDYQTQEENLPGDNVIAVKQEPPIVETS